MIHKQTIYVSQLRAADLVLEKLRRALAPEFLGLVSTSGHTLSVTVIPECLDPDVFASLAASSFAASSQLARVMNETAFTVMFQEGNNLNVHIAQVLENILLVVCFQKSTQIGKVRLITAHAAKPLAQALGQPGVQAENLDGSSGEGSDDVPDELMKAQGE